MRWLWRQSAKWTILSALLREKAVVIALFLFASVYLLFSFFEIPLWRCAWREVTGWRCPGCGLTTGCKAFLRGNFSEGFAANWFTPAVLLGLILVPAILALPSSKKEQALKKLAAFEGRIRIVLLVVLFLIVQTIARLGGWA